VVRRGFEPREPDHPRAHHRQMDRRRTDGIGNAQSRLPGAGRQRRCSKLADQRAVIQGGRRLPGVQQRLDEQARDRCEAPPAAFHAREDRSAYQLRERSGARAMGGEDGADVPGVRARGEPCGPTRVFRAPANRGRAAARDEGLDRRRQGARRLVASVRRHLQPPADARRSTPCFWRSIRSPSWSSAQTTSWPWPTLPSATWATHGRRYGRCRRRRRGRRRTHGRRSSSRACPRSWKSWWGSRLPSVRGEPRKRCANRRHRSSGARWFAAQCRPDRNDPPETGASYFVQGDPLMAVAFAA
jgi:hypothetical protein